MRETVRLVALLVLLPIVGTLGFHFIEGWGFFDALYMSITTLSTVGFMEVHPLSTAGRTFVMIYLVAGLGVFLFAVAQVGERLVRAELNVWWERRAMDERVRALTGHFVVCGFGRMGRLVCQHLADRRLSFVVVESNPIAAEVGRTEGWPVVEGDAGDDRVLEQAGIQRARGLAAVLSTDADNLYVVLSARLLKRDLQIIARASDDASVSKLEKAGANHVISLYGTGALKAAQLLANPSLEDFYEVFSTEGSQLDLAGIQVRPGDDYVGRTIEQTDFRRRGILIVGVRRADGTLAVPPPRGFTIEQGDQLIALGKSEAILSLDPKR